MRTNGFMTRFRSNEPADSHPHTAGSRQSESLIRGDV